MAAKVNRDFQMAAWERYMDLDRGADYSMTCHSRFWFEGQLSREEFTAAVVRAAELHPFMALKQTGRKWSAVKFDPNEQIDWQPANAPVKWKHLEQDDSVMRFIVRVGDIGEFQLDGLCPRGSFGAFLVVKYPHSVADGNGIFALLKTISDLLAGKEPVVEAAASLDYRLNYGLSRRQRIYRSRHDLMRVLRFFSNRPIGYGQRRDPSSLEKSAEICVLQMAVSPERLEKIHLQTQARGVRLNDLLIASFFRVLARGRGAKEVIRMAIPISMRPAENRSLCNLVSMVFLDRRVSEIGRGDLLESVSREMQFIKANELGHAMLWFVRLGVGLGEGVLGTFLRKSKFHVTAVLTNLGRPFADEPEFRLGGWHLVRLDSIPPLRPGTNLALSVNRLGDSLTLTLRYDPNFVSRDEAESICAELILQSEQALFEP